MSYSLTWLMFLHGSCNLCCCTNMAVMYCKQVIPSKFFSLEWNTQFGCRKVWKRVWLPLRLQWSHRWDHSMVLFNNNTTTIFKKVDIYKTHTFCFNQTQLQVGYPLTTKRPLPGTPDSRKSPLWGEGWVLGDFSCSLYLIKSHTMILYDHLLLSGNTTGE